MTRVFSVICSLLTLVLVGCGTTQVRMEQQTYTGAKANHPVIAIGAFTDQRKHDPKWLGAIRGGFGNPLKTLETPKPVKDVVRDAFEQGLKQRGLLAIAGKATFTLNGDVVQYDCNQYVRKEAHVSLTMKLVNTATNREVYSKAIAIDHVEGSRMSMKTGIFASVDDLKALAERTLAQAVRDFFDDPGFKNIYQ
jgi:hypothetical protein